MCERAIRDIDKILIRWSVLAGVMSPPRPGASCLQNEIVLLAVLRVQWQLFIRPGKKVVIKLVIFGRVIKPA